MRCAWRSARFISASVLHGGRKTEQIREKVDTRMNWQYTKNFVWRAAVSVGLIVATATAEAQDTNTAARGTVPAIESPTNPPPGAVNIELPEGSSNAVTARTE